MARKSWLLNRRTLLRGAGVALALPWLEAMAHAAPTATASKPRRFCGLFFGNGVGLPNKKDPTFQDWHWFPHEEGKDFRFTKSIDPLEPHRADLSIFGGMSHATSRQLVGHNTADVWLSGADIRKNLNNSISLDQLIARQYGDQTRVPSLVLSSNGGVGVKSRTTTISFDAQGRAIPAESSPRSIFERLFERPSEKDHVARAKALASDKRRVDFLLDDARSLRNRLGRPDQQRLDEFLQSLSEVESRLIRTEDWLGKAMPYVDRTKINLDVSPKGPTDFIRTMFDLIVLAFETDTTRVATYQIAAEDGVGICDRFPAILGIGQKHGHHGVSHGPTEHWAKYDRYLSEQFAYFLQRLSKVREPDGRLLDDTLVLYGSGTSTTHNARNYPLMLAGGKNMGLKHGRFFKHKEERALGDLFVTMLHQMDIPVKSFADNTGEFTELVG